MAQTSWGGARKGAGRKPAKPGEERKVRTFRLTDMEYALAKLIHKEVKKKKTFSVVFGPRYPDGAIGHFKNEPELVPIEEAEQISHIQVKEDMTLNDDQLLAYKAMQSGKNIFLSGGAGTGKSYVLRKFIVSAEAAGKQVLVCAPTGIAAQNIGGVTVHHAFRVPIGIIMPSMMNPKDFSVHLGKQKKVIAAADIVVIDEISMLRADVFEYVMRIIQQEDVPHFAYNEETKRKEKIRHHIQVIVCGDFAQLPPVIGSREQEAWNNTYPANPHGFAFLSLAWHFDCYNLTNVIRQKNAQFAEALNSIRLGKEVGLNYINEHRAKHRISTAIDLCSTNREAEKINFSAVESLHSKAKTYYLNQDGKISNSDITLPRELTIKIGCRVILCANDREEGYYNGQFATVVELKDDSVVVQLENEQRAEIKRKTISVENYIEVEDKETGKKKLQKVEIGSFNQIPLKLGYAVTIHRSQGQTYDAINLHLGNIFASGQLYVALSRCRSVETTYFYHPVKPESMFIDDEVLNFYKNI